MMNFFEPDQTFEKAKEEAYTPQNLTPGRYKLLITGVQVGRHPKGEKFIPSTDPMFVVDNDLEFRFECTTTDKVGDFPAGWKHTFFFQTRLKDDQGMRSTRAKIALGDMQRISEACGFLDWPKDIAEWQGKMFVATFSHGYAKNDTAHEKPFLNLDKVEPASAWGAPVAQASATVAPATQPAQVAAAPQVMPLGSTMEPVNNSAPDWR